MSSRKRSSPCSYRSLSPLFDDLGRTKVNLNLTSGSLHCNSRKVALPLTQTNQGFIALAGFQYRSIFKRRVYHEIYAFRVADSKLS